MSERLFPFGVVVKGPLTDPGSMLNEAGELPTVAILFRTVVIVQSRKKWWRGCELDGLVIQGCGLIDMVLSIECQTLR